MGVDHADGATGQTQTLLHLLRAGGGVDDDGAVTPKPQGDFLPPDEGLVEDGYEVRALHGAVRADGPVGVAEADEGFDGGALLLGAIG